MNKGRGNNELRTQSSALRNKATAFFLISALCILSSELGSAASGTEGASFLDIPVGAGPAAMGSAYSALAADVYAPTINPGGLGFLRSTQFTGQHLSYINSNHYEYLSVVHPSAPRPDTCSGCTAVDRSFF